MVALIEPHAYKHTQTNIYPFKYIKIACFTKMYYCEWLLMKKMIHFKLILYAWPTSNDVTPNYTPIFTTFLFYKSKWRTLDWFYRCVFASVGVAGGGGDAVHNGMRVIYLARRKSLPFIFSACVSCKNLSKIHQK